MRYGLRDLRKGQFAEAKLKFMFELVQDVFGWQSDSPDLEQIFQFDQYDRRTQQVGSADQLCSVSSDSTAAVAKP